VSPSAGSSGTPLPRKLGIKRGARLGLMGAPAGFDITLGELPQGVAVFNRARGPLDVIVAFFESRSALARRLPALRDALDPAGELWIAWPKRSSGVETDLGDGAVRELGLAAELVDNKVCAIDEVWSALRFVPARRPSQALISRSSPSAISRTRGRSSRCL
jgi:hypothetical protein